MRYKNNVLDKLVTVDTAVNRIQLQVNRNINQDQILESIDALKESLESIREIISVEPDDFEQQFRG
jgi:division protein CdvB (Snf7/Vps24/ESCRT-III family)